MHKVARIYYKRCQEYGLDPVLIPETSGFFVKFGQKQFSFRGGDIPLNNIVAVSMSSDKYIANQLLSNAGIPVPKAKAYTREAYFNGEADFSDFKFPVVIKPAWGSGHGFGVICNIPNATELDALLRKSYEKYHYMGIEEYYGNLKSFRVLVFNDDVIALMERVPAHVIGDGKSTIQELIDNENKKREEQNIIMPFGKIIMTEETDLIFREMKISPTDIPVAQQKIPIRLACNAGIGGTVIGLRKTAICKENADIAVRAAKVLNLQLAGLDFLCNDLGTPIDKSGGCILEANHDPDISAHEYSPLGVPSFPSKYVVKYLIRKYRWSYYWQQLQRKSGRKKAIKAAIPILMILWFLIDTFILSAR